MMMNVVCVSGEIVSKSVSIVTNGPRMGRRWIYLRVVRRTGRTAIMKLFVEYDDECCVCVWEISFKMGVLGDQWSTGRVRSDVWSVKKMVTS